ncbi:hypothetical protein GCM10009734_48780 [Nonomuraea bangladeshensis]
MVLVDPRAPGLDPLGRQRLVVDAPCDQHVEPSAELAGPVLADPLIEEIAPLDDRSHLRHVTYSSHPVGIGNAYRC